MIVWDGGKFKIGDVRFQSISGLNELFTLKNEDGYVVGKFKSYIDKYVTLLAGNEGCNIIELGVFRGGSTVFLNELLKPKRLAAVDIARKVPPMLAQYIKESPRAAAIKAFMGVDQASLADLAQICDGFLEKEPIDIVIDDASHYYDEAKTSFQFLFPRLRPGGLYVIEDWGWANHRIDAKEVSADFADRKPLTNLIFEIVLAANTAPEIIPEVQVNKDFVVVQRGAAAISDPFDLGDYCFDHGKKIVSTAFFN